jgi:hypothetical protein
MGSGDLVPPFLMSARDGGEWSASRPCRFTPGERALSSHWIGSWVGLRAGLDASEKRSFGPSGSGTLAARLVAPAIPTEG